MEILRRHRVGWLVVCVLATGLACGGPTAPSSDVTFSTDFRQGMQGWQFDVAHRGINCSGAPPQAIGEIRIFGPPNESSGSGLFLQTLCYSVFAFVKKSVRGLFPGATYRVTPTVEIETDTPATPCIPQSVQVEFNSRSAFGTVVYGAATSTEPKLIPDGQGVQLEGGLLRSGFLGDISTSEKRCGPQGPLSIWEFRSHTGGGALVMADSRGEAWLVAGFSGDWTRIYLSRVSMTFTPVRDSRASQ